MGKKEKPKRIFRRVDDIIDNNFGISNPPPEPVDNRPFLSKVFDAMDGKAPAKKILDLIPKELSGVVDMGNGDKAERPAKKEKAETLNSTKKRVEKIYAEHIKDLPKPSRIVTAKDIKAWVLQNPALNVNSPEFLDWLRSPDGTEPNAYVVHFGKLLQELGLDHNVEVEQKGYVYDYFVAPMSLYIDIDPVSLDTDDPKAKISITIDKSKMDVMQIWRNINDAREAKVRPYRFLAIKERLYKEAVKEFCNEYIDWYYQKISQ